MSAVIDGAANCSFSANMCTKSSSDGPPSRDLQPRSPKRLGNRRCPKAAVPMLPNAAISSFACAVVSLRGIEKREQIFD
jgi:hypothetical protein